MGYAEEAGDVRCVPISADSGGGELLDHGKQQLAVAVVEVGGVATDLREEAELVVGELLRLKLTSQIILSEQLGKRELKGAGDFGKGVERRDSVPVFHA